MTSRSSALRSATSPRHSASWPHTNRRRYLRCFPMGVAGVGPIYACQAATFTSFKEASGSRLVEHLLHPGDLDPLVAGDELGELEDARLLSATGVGQVLSHDHRALVVPDHVLE